MISTTQSGDAGVVHSHLERAEDYIQRTSMTPSPAADGRGVTANTVGDNPLPRSTIVSPTSTAPAVEMIEESTEDVAHLLTIVADIAAREAPLPIDDDVGGRQQPEAAGRARIRAVSMASPDLRPRPPPSTPIGDVYSLAAPQMIPQSPAVANDFPPPIRRHGYAYSSSSSDEGQYLWSAAAGPREQREVAASLSSTPPKKTPRHRHRTAKFAPSPRPVVVTPKKRKSRPNPGGGRQVLHKKFSWKNYPEVSSVHHPYRHIFLYMLSRCYLLHTRSQCLPKLKLSLPILSCQQLEEFLIANRDEYLRHSTLNYTVQQKQYNNRLTERLLELAADCGYAFDEHEFSFVAVRDRIRCYYKSYVQSLKKRGIVIGYAARKAGLVTNDDLEKSACKKATIYVPSAMKH